MAKGGKDKTKSKGDNKKGEKSEGKGDKSENAKKPQKGDGKKPPTGKGDKGKKSMAKNSHQSITSLGEKKLSGDLPSTARKSEKLEPDWDSEEVKAHKLLKDGFTYCMVMVMEDSADLTTMGHFLQVAVKTGIRKKFHAINGEEIAAIVKKFTSTSQTQTPPEQESAGEGEEDFWEKSNIWAEAVKNKLIQIKEGIAKEMSSGNKRKEMELTGARSKDLIQQFPPISIKPSGSEPTEEPSGIREAPPAPPPSSGAAMLEAKDPPPPEEEKQRSKKRKSVQGKKEKLNEATVEASRSQGSGSLHKAMSDGSSSSSTKTRSANMRKRGELPMPNLEEINDTPVKGPLAYIILQGFYNPKLIEELEKIGVAVDGILLLTDQKMNKRNFSVMDVEDSIPGTFRPKNILPTYLKQLEQQTNLPRPDRDVVAQFWAGLAEIYNTVPANSPLLDCALMNFTVPKHTELESPEARGAYASKLFDEAAQRIYEMLVMSDWFHDYAACSNVKQIKDLEENMGQVVYETLINQVPEECVTVPIIMECLLEQVVANVDKDKPPDKAASASNFPEDQDKFSEYKKFGKSEWGVTILQDGLKTLTQHADSSKDKKNPLGPTFTPPLYIKNGDYASIRSCHLNETVASHIASTQVAGDLRNLQGLLYNDVPEFNKSLYIKLLCNLNHFMFFLPPDVINFEDMFFILHLLMSAGVEAQLHKEAEAAEANAEANEENKATKKSVEQFSQMVHNTTRDLFSSHGENTENQTFEGTNLDKDHNYLALNEETGLHFIMAPDSKADITIASIGHSKEAAEAASKSKMAGSATAIEESKLGQKPSVEAKLSKERSLSKQAADILTDKTIESAAELADFLEEEDPGEGYEEDEGFNDGAEAAVDENENIAGDQSYHFGETDPKKSGSNRFIACEAEWFKDMNDFSVFKALLECPALLAISESGALDLSKWIETYLLSAGMSQVGGDGVLIGNLKDWNYVEELVPVQTVQLLNEAVQNYFAMQRMYCPFYDTLLFIFNSPIPTKLKSESQFYYKLKTLPGLQHFLEFSINDNDVLTWLMGQEKVTGAEVIDTLSITTLMKIVPEEQWLLVPSIKYMLFKEQSDLSRSASEKLEEVAPPVPEVSEVIEVPAEKPKEKRKKGKSMTPEDTERDNTTMNSKHKSKRNSDPGDKRKKRNSKFFEPEKSKRTSIALSNEPSTDQQLKTEEVSVDGIPSFHINEAIGQQKNSLQQSKFKQSEQEHASKAKGAAKGNKFDFYDLGKRVIVVASDTYHVFPMDGSTIQYDISTIEPEFRMMQLKVSKNGHESFFYPYYIPHDLDLSRETYLVCPYFHMVHANGTIFAFQDRRATESAPYVKVFMKESETENTLFSYDKVFFGTEVNTDKRGSMSDTSVKKSSVSQKDSAEKNTPTQLFNMSQASIQNVEDSLLTIASETEMEEEEEEETQDLGKKQKKGKQPKKEKEKPKEAEKEKEKEKEKPSETKVKEEKSKKKVKGKKGKSDSKMSQIIDLGDDEEEEQENTPAKSTSQETTTGEGEWVYSDGELTDGEGGSKSRKKRSFYAPNWDDAEILLKPMVHRLKITLPSSLLVEVDDVEGPPLQREVKQSYSARGTAALQKESSRYYTMNGTVVKFMLNKTIQILTARGVTINIRELATNAQRDDERLHEVFESAKIVKIFNGEIILPNGEFWNIVDGNRVQHDPIYVFTTDTLPNGEVFRRRQDGVVYLHRHDGTTITHYPDGTRFTTRMVIQRDVPEDLDDFVVVGLKYMIEHPNYCSVIFNTLSGNTHIRLPLGDWARIFADGSMKITTNDNYSMDVDQHRAILSFPPCGGGDPDIPNLTAVKLWHQAAAPPEGATATTSSKENVQKEQENINPTEGESLTTRTSTPESLKVVPSKQILDGKKTRGGKGKTSGKNLRQTSNKGKDKRNSIDTVERSTITVDLEGEIEEEEEQFEEEEEAEEIQEEEEEMEDPEKSSQDKKFEIEEFLKFTDPNTLLCKAVDSWDNRFAVDVYGETIVDKSESSEEEVQISTEELITALSEHCKLPREFISGILHTTSSDDLATAAKRLIALKKTAIESCGALPPTRIFVVKRNLTGYEYFKKAQVESFMERAKKHRESMVTVDPLPNRDPRKFLTIMEPVCESGKPRGMWTNLYREPTFRPVMVTNKSFRASGRDDVRWFGYVLNAANRKRPSFIPNAKADFLERLEQGRVRKEPPEKPATQRGPGSTEMKTADIPAESKTDVKSSKKSKNKDKGKKEKSKKDKSKKDEDPSNQDDDLPKNDADPSKKDKEPAKKGKDASKKDKESSKKKDASSKKGKDKQPKDAKGEPVVDTKAAGDAKSTTDLKSSKRRSLTKEKDKKQWKKMDSLPVEMGEEFLGENEEDEEEVQVPKKSLIDNDIGSYPPDVPDLEGIYDTGDQVKFQPQFHADICTERKAIVVRSFVEIPQIDERLQRALLAASVSYAQTIEGQLGVLEANKLQDPRSDEEKKHQADVKQQLIENNLSDMHLLEQRAGRVLRFHF